MGLDYTRYGGVDVRARLQTRPLVRTSGGAAQWGSQSSVQSEGWPDTLSKARGLISTGPNNMHINMEAVSPRQESSGAVAVGAAAIFLLSPAQAPKNKASTLAGESEQGVRNA